MQFETVSVSDELIQLVEKYGKNSNSFMTLYPGLQYFRSPNPNTPGVIAFMKLSHSWIGGAEPLGPPAVYSNLLNDFANEAAKEGKSAILIPVGSEVTQIAVDNGYKSLFIGTEPTFDLNWYPKSGNTWIDVVPTAKHLDARGAQVFELDPKTCSPEKKKVLDSITQEWLDSRKMEPLRFLNKVEPWTLSQHKKYFYLELQGRILAFLAAIPIFPRKGWYLIDLTRRNNAPAGTTELLTLQAIRLLRNSGANEISLGVSPLSQIEQISQIPLANSEHHRYLYPFLNYLYQSGGRLYGFKSLYDYKLKFGPTSSQPMFLIYKSHTQKPQLSLFSIVNVFEVFLGKSLFKAIPLIVWRNFSKLSADRFIKTRINSNVIVRSTPRTWKDLFYRCKATGLLFITNIIIYYLSSGQSGKIDPQIESRWSYSWKVFSASPVNALVLSPFLHWNELHLVTNMIMMIFFTGVLEYLCGTKYTMISYFLPMLLTNPLTSLLLIPIHAVDSTSADIGASLGIFGCLGVLSTLLKQGRLLMGIFLTGSFAFSILSKDWMNLNHWVALILGYFMGIALI